MFFRSRIRKPAPPQLKFNELVDAFGGRQRLFQQTLIAPEFKFIYFNNPKVACSTTKATLNLAVAERLDIPFEITSMSDIHQRAGSPIGSVMRVGRARFMRMLRDPEVFRFTFVRDPLKRLQSAYVSKLIQPYRRGSPHWTRLADHLGRDRRNGLSFAEFARLCREDPEARDLDPHWCLQRTHVGFDVVDYGYIGGHEAFDAGFRAVLRRVFGEEVPIFDTRAQFGRSSHHDISDQITDAVRADVRAAYAADYAMIEEIAARDLGRLPA